MEAKQEVRMEDKGRLEPGQVIPGELKGGEGHRYQIELQAGQYLHVVVEQKGVDVAVQLFTPAGEGRPVVDSPNGDQGPEDVLEVTDSGGVYRLEIRAIDASASSGGYETSIAEAREANEEDRVRHRASLRFAEAEELRRQKTREGHRGALEAYQEVLPLWQALKDRPREAATLERIGIVYQELKEPAGALVALRQVLPLYEALKDHKKLGLVHNLIGAALYDQGEFAEAIPEHRLALASFEDPYYQSAALNNAGNAHLALGQIQEALDAQREALRLARAGKNSTVESKALFGIGDAFTTQGKLDLALDSLEDALQLENSLDAPDRRANVLRRIANVLERMGRLGEAQHHLEQALAIQESVGDLLGEAVTLNSLGIVLLNQGETDKALPRSERALELFRQLQSSDGQAIALLNLGRYYYAVGDARRAFQAHEEAAALFRKIEDPADEASTLFGSARALHDLGDYAGALARLEKVLDRVELLREASTSTDLRTAFFATKQHYFDLYVDVLMHLHEKDNAAGWDEKAFQINERRRARGMLDLLAEAGSELRRGADQALVARERELQEQISALEIALASTRAEGADTASLEKRQRALLAELDEVQSKIRGSSPRFRELTAAPLEIRDIQKKVLDRGSVLLVFSLGEERSFLWLLTDDGALESHVLPARSWIDDMAKRVYSSWSKRGGSRRGGAERWASRLSETLIKPVVGRLGSKRLVIVSDGALQYLAFGALPDPVTLNDQQERPLLWNHEIVHLPSASVVAGLRRDFGDRMTAPLQIAVIADPVFSTSDQRLLGGKENEHLLSGDIERSVRDLGIEGFERLPFTGTEAEIIRGLVQEDRRFEALGFEANRSTVTNGELKRYRVLHFATHGVLNEKHPNLSGLVLSLVDAEGRPQNGFLRGYEICGLDLRAELVVLSACQTGLGEEVRGEGLVGLTRSFMYAGAPRMVVSLWSVNDRSSAELMQRFYRGMYAHRLTPAAALRCAQLAMIRSQKWDDPFHWAPFVFQGEWLSRLDGSQVQGDEGIEAPADGSNTPKRADNTLPPPEAPVPPRCPEVL